MESKQPLVSIALIAYQNAPFLVESIEGILAQTYPNIEVIISDDGSTDGSGEIIEKYTAMYTQIRYLSSTVNRGVAENMNISFKHCVGEYLCVIAADDAMYPDKIKKQVEFLANNPDYDLCFHNVDVYDEDTGLVQYQWLDKFKPTRFPTDALFRANWFFKRNNRKTPSGSWFGRSSYLKQSINDKRTSIYHEFLYTLGMYAAKPHGKWHTLTEVLGKYRVHSRSMSNTKSNWTGHAEDISTCYTLAAVKFPQYIRQIQKEEAYWWFSQLLYNQVPDGSYGKYRNLFIRKYGFLRYIYLVACKILLGSVFAPVRKTVKGLKRLFFK